MTGGAGFIGVNLVRLLVSRGYDVTVLDNLSASDGRHLKGLPVRLAVADIRHADQLDQHVAGCWGVVHLAAQTGVPGSVADPRSDCESNVLGTLNVLEACRRSAPRARFVFASSNAPLGRQAPPAREDKAPLPISPYGASKLAGEGYCLAYHATWGLGAIVLRFANVYGPFCDHKGSVVARFLKDAAAKRALTVFGDGSQTRDFLYVGDLSSAIIRALESGINGEVFQVATGVETTVLELAEMMRDVVDGDLAVVHEPSRLGDIRKNYSDISKARALLGWQPETALRDGLRLTWEYLASAGVDAEVG